MEFYLKFIGGSTSVVLHEEIIAKVGKRLYFSSCDSFDKDTMEEKLILPATAYNDEGTSYHYATASKSHPLKNGSRFYVWQVTVGQ